MPLDQADEAFGVPDATGRIPIVLLPSAPNRIRNSFLVAGVVAAVVGLILDVTLVLRGGLLAVGVLLVFLGMFRSFIVPVPEGSKAILLRRGRIDRTIGPGNHIIPPWIAVSHLVTTREIPFDVPVSEVPTQEGLRVSVDVLLTFRITRPEQFVFAISAPDFDQVCQAAGQDALRMLIRSTTAEHVLDLAGTESAQLAATTGRALAGYGVQVERVVILHIRPPDEFMRSLEGRRIAAVQRDEEVERHALEQRRQDGSGVARATARRVQARADRDRGRQRGAPPGTAPGTSRRVSPRPVPLRPRVGPVGRREGARRQYARHAPGRIGRRHRERPRDARPGRRAGRR